MIFIPENKSTNWFKRKDNFLPKMIFIPENKSTNWFKRKDNFLPKMILFPEKIPPLFYTRSSIKTG
jgi:hypothetical protein